MFVQLRKKRLEEEEEQKKKNLIGEGSNRPAGAKIVER